MGFGRAPKRHVGAFWQFLLPQLGLETGETACNEWKDDVGDTVGTIVDCFQAEVAVAGLTGGLPSCSKVAS